MISAAQIGISDRDLFVGPAGCDRHEPFSRRQIDGRGKVVTPFADELIDIRALWRAGQWRLVAKPQAAMERRGGHGRIERISRGPGAKNAGFYGVRPLAQSRSNHWRNRVIVVGAWW